MEEDNLKQIDHFLELSGGKPFLVLSELDPKGEEGGET